MKKGKETADAVEILLRRYVGEDAERKTSIQEERVNAEVANTIYDLRKEAGLSQKELAELVGTTQSVISRLEDSDYRGHSLKMLNGIARALNRRLKVMVGPDDEDASTFRYVFREVVRGLRRSRGLTREELAVKLDLDEDEVVAMERNSGYRPPPLTLHKLSEFYDIPQENLAMLAGAVKEVPPSVREEASSYAAKSDTFSKLTPEEKRALDEFVKFLKKEQMRGD